MDPYYKCRVYLLNYLYNNLYRFMHRLILFLYKEIVFKITYIGVFIKLVYTVMLNSDSDVTCKRPYGL
jgi:hypothetical protein